MYYSFIATGYFLFCNTQNANKYYTCKYENIKIGSLKCSSLFACLSYTEYDSSIFSTFFVFFREFWTSLTRMSLRSRTRQEHTYSTLVEKIYTTTRERVHECLRNVIPCVLYFLRVTLCPASCWEIIRLVLWYICLRNIS